MSGTDLALAAHALVGTRFRLNGRDPHTGLDCLGVLAASLAAIGRPRTLPPCHSLRQRGQADVEAMARSAGLVRGGPAINQGDVLLVRCSPVQLHLLIAFDELRFVHAHASLRRVVVGERDPGWITAGHWRLPAIG